MMITNLLMAIFNLLLIYVLGNHAI